MYAPSLYRHTVIAVLRQMRSPFSLPPFNTAMTACFRRDSFLSTGSHHHKPALPVTLPRPAPHGCKGGPHQ